MSTPLRIRYERDEEMMTDHVGKFRQIFLQPGDIYLSETPAVVSTLLGSCVAVTMFSPRLRAGGICHGFLPACNGEKPCDCEKPCADGVRYVDCSIMRMLGWFIQLGTTRQEIEVKVFGGSDMMAARGITAKGTVGQKNISMAFTVIEREMLAVAASDVGGMNGRKLIFSTDTGDVLLKRLGKRSANP